MNGITKHTKVSIALAIALGGAIAIGSAKITAMNWQIGALENQTRQHDAEIRLLTEKLEAVHTELQEFRAELTSDMMLLKYKLGIAFPDRPTALSELPPVDPREYE